MMTEGWNTPDAVKAAPKAAPVRRVLISDIAPVCSVCCPCEREALSVVGVFDGKSDEDSPD